MVKGTILLRPKKPAASAGRPCRKFGKAQKGRRRQPGWQSGAHKNVQKVVGASRSNSAEKGWGRGPEAYRKRDFGRADGQNGHTRRLKRALSEREKASAGWRKRPFGEVVRASRQRKRSFGDCTENGSHWQSAVCKCV